MAKCISIKQPWAHLICTPRQDNQQLGIKDIENRTWATKFRGKVLVHASAKPDYDIIYTDNKHIYNVLKERGLLFEDDIDAFCAVGAIIGSVEIVDCVLNHPSIWAEKTLNIPERGPIQKPIYNFVLANPVLFDKPIPAKGKLSFWDYPNILAEPEEKDGELFCHCHLPIKEENQVMRMHDHFRCRYCGGIWYK